MARLPTSKVSVPESDTGMTNDNTLKMFLDRLVRASGLSPMTADMYRLKLSPFFRYQNGKPLAAWSYADFEDYVASREWSANTTRKFVVSCKKFISWCQDRGIDCADFVGNFKPRKGPRKEPKVATREEVVKLLDAAKNHKRKGMRRLHVCIALAALAGLRRSELETLTWGNVALEHRLLTIHSPKTLKKDTIRISDKLAEILTSWQQDGDQPEDQVIRWTSFAQKTGNGNRDLAKLCAEAEIRRIGWHAFRHFFCATMLNGGAPVGDVQELMRHGSLKTTTIYAHPSKAGMAKAVEMVL